MDLLIRYLLIAVLFLSSSFALSNADIPQNDGTWQRDGNTTFWADESEQPKLADYSLSKPMPCPKVADPNRYFTRYMDIDVEAGKVTCALYAYTSPQKILSIKSRTYQAMDKYYQSSASDYNSVGASLNTDTYKDMDTQIKAVKDQIFAQYNSGTKKFLPMSTYYTALFSMNGSIIDIPRTIEENKVETKPQYTIYPSEVGVTYENKKSIMDYIQSAWNWITSKSTNEQAMDKAESEQYTSMTAETQSVHSASIVTFFAKLAPVFNDMAATLLFLIGGYGVSMGAFSAMTKRLSSISNFDNYIEKGVVAAGVLGMMFVTPTNYTVNGNKDMAINQSRALGLFQSGFLYGDEWARKATNALIATQISELSKRAGIYAPETIKRNSARMKKIQEQLLPVDRALFDVCKATYSIPALKKDFGENIFPTYELKGVYGATPYSYAGYVQPGMDRPDATTLGSMISLTGCGKIRDRILRYTLEYNDDMALITKANKALNSTDMMNKVKALAMMQYKASAEYGWFAIAIVPSTKAMVDIMNMFGDEKSMDDNNEAAANVIASRSPEKGWVAEKVKTFGAAPLALLTRLPYLAAPGFSSIYDMLKVDRNGVLINMLKKIPFLGKVISPLLKFGANIAIFVATVFIYKIMLNYMILLTLTLITCISILFWLLKVLIYVFSIPFAVPFAFLGDNKGKIFGFAGKGVELWFTPFLIVISVYIAMYSNYFIGDFTPTIIAQQMSSLTGVSAMGSIENGSVMNEIHHVFRIVLFDMYNSMLLLGAKILSLGIVAILSFGGPAIMLRLLGLGSMEDLGNHLGERLVGKQSRFTEV